MKKNIKTFVLGFVCGFIVLGIINTNSYAKEYLLKLSGNKIFINNVEYQNNQLPLLEMDGDVYVPLKNFAAMTGININLNENLKRIDLNTSSSLNNTISPINNTITPIKNDINNKISNIGVTITDVFDNQIIDTNPIQTPNIEITDNKINNNIMNNTIMNNNMNNNPSPVDLNSLIGTQITIDKKKLTIKSDSKYGVYLDLKGVRYISKEFVFTSIANSNNVYKFLRNDSAQSELGFKTDLNLYDILKGKIIVKDIPSVIYQGREFIRLDFYLSNIANLK